MDPKALFLLLFLEVFGYSRPVLIASSHSLRLNEFLTRPLASPPALMTLPYVDSGLLRSDRNRVRELTREIRSALRGVPDEVIPFVWQDIVKTYQEKKSDVIRMLHAVKDQTQVRALCERILKRCTQGVLSSMKKLRIMGDTLVRVYGEFNQVCRVQREVSWSSRGSYSPCENAFLHALKHWGEFGDEFTTENLTRYAFILPSRTMASDEGWELPRYVFPKFDKDLIDKVKNQFVIVYAAQNLEVLFSPQDKTALLYSRIGAKKNILTFYLMSKAPSVIAGNVERYYNSSRKLSISRRYGKQHGTR